MNADAIGIVVGESSPQQFTFVSSEESVPPRLEYVVARGVRERVDDHDSVVDLLAQVTGTRADVLTLGGDLDYQEAQTVVSQHATLPPRVYADAHVLGFLRGDVVQQARGAVLPGTPVARAPDSLLRQFFSVPAAASESQRLTPDSGGPAAPAGIRIGSLINRPGVEVVLDPNGLSRHLAIIAQTGAGKSYLAGKILDDLLALGATLIVLDPNSDYVQLRKERGDAEVPFNRASKAAHADRISLYRVPGVQHRRYTDELVGPSRPYTIRFSELDAEDICDVAGVPERAERIREAVANTVARQRRQRRDFTPRELAVELAGFAGVALDDADGLEETPHASATDGASHVLAPPDGDDVAAAAEYLGRLGRGNAGGLASAATVGPRSRGGRAAAGEEEELRGARLALRYIKKLIRYPVWGQSSIDLDSLLEPMKLTVLDLAGTERVVMAYTAEWLLSSLWERALGGRLSWPVFVVLEEAHNLVPSGNQTTKASRIVNTVAAEGRKFGVFLIVITQRPSKISDDTLSQCASQLIMRLTNPDDQRAVQRASEVVSQSLLEDLPGLNQGEAVVLGRLTRIPVMVKVGGRRSAEGGADIDLVGSLHRAHLAASVAAAMRTTAKPEPPRTGRRQVELL